MSEVLWRRLNYFLSPQLDIYRSIGPRMKGLSVLEVGFGTGTGTLQLVPRARNVTAIEVDIEAVEFARSAYPNQADWQKGSILDYRIESRYEAVVMIEVLEHIKDWRRAIDNIYASLVPGGKLFMSARNANADLRKNELHEREWTGQEFRSSLLEYFQNVTLWDYTLKNEQNNTTRMTPLVAEATK